MAVGSKVGMIGDAVPLHGNSEIRQSGSTTIDVLTVTLNSSVSSTTGGKGLYVSRYAEGIDPSSGSMILSVDYDGVQARRHVTALPVSATTYTVSASQSGALFTVAASSAIIVTLPAVEAGLWYEFVGMGACASGFSVKGASTGLMVVFNDDAADSVEVGTSGVGAPGGALRVVCNGTKWLCITEPGFSSVAPTTATASYYTIVS